MILKILGHGSENPVGHDSEKPLKNLGHDSGESQRRGNVVSEADSVANVSLSTRSLGADRCKPLLDGAPKSTTTSRVLDANFGPTGTRLLLAGGYRAMPFIVPCPPNVPVQRQAARFELRPRRLSAATGCSAAPYSCSRKRSIVRPMSFAILRSKVGEMS